MGPFEKMIAVSRQHGTEHRCCVTVVTRQGWDASSGMLASPRSQRAQVTRFVYGEGIWCQPMIQTRV